MKIRNGFVSNSSSSSFIVEGTVKDVAQYMLSIVAEHSKDWDDGYTERIQKQILNLGTLKDDVKSVMFNSTNYNTFLVQIENEVYISTSNNHAWEMSDVFKVNFHGIGADDSYDDKAHLEIMDNEFIDLYDLKLISYKEGRGW